MSHEPAAAGLAALSICESLILSLTDNGIIDAAEAKVILEDAATAHRNAAGPADSAPSHAEAASIIEHIVKGGNAVRRR